jgi:hypothetical protein
MKTAKQGDHWVRKTLRAASGDTISVEWEDYSLGDDGKYYRGYGGSGRCAMVASWSGEHIIRDI